MDLYLKLDRDTVQQFEHGTQVSGSIYQNEKLTIPHDLSSYDELNLKMFRKYQEFNYAYEPLTKVTGDGNENKWVMVVKPGTFIYEGIYYITIVLSSTGISASTFPEEFFVQGSGGSNGQSI